MNLGEQIFKTKEPKHGKNGELIEATLGKKKYYDSKSLKRPDDQDR